MATPGEHHFPVEVGSYDPATGERRVRLTHHDGSFGSFGVHSGREFAEIVQRCRPDTDLDDPEQVHWDDHPGEWPQA